MLKSWINLYRIKRHFEVYFNRLWNPYFLRI